MQVFVMIFALLVLQPKHFFISLVTYILLGAIGLPVFSSMRGGIGVLAGPTGGFLWGFILGAICAFAVFAAFDKLVEGKPLAPEKLLKKVTTRSVVRGSLGGLVFLVIMYVCGWMQLMVVAGIDPMAAFVAGVAPFILIDIAKTAVAITTANVVRQALPRNFLSPSKNG